jgi:N-dimethylarginine dimethylaminohydrolase
VADEASRLRTGWFQLEYARTQVIILRRLPPASAKVLDVGRAASSIGGACSLPITFVPFSAIWPPRTALVPTYRHRAEGWSSVPCLRIFSPLLSPEMLMQVLLCPPTHFDVIDQKNSYMGGGFPIDRAKAQEQWQSLCSALEDAGYQVETIAPAPGHEDMVFAANPVFVGFHKDIGKFIVPSRMVHPSRQREVPFYVDWYRQRGFKIVKVDLGSDYLEGNGDLLWHPGWSRVYAGYCFRSTKSGVERFGKAISKLEIPVVPLHLVDPYYYHLDTCFCPLNNEAVLIYSGAYAAESLAALRPLWNRVHELTADEAHKFMGNGIVANGRYFTSHITTHLESILCEEGLAPVIVESSEFEKSGGSLFCMKAFLP